jgi:hypothetical protein
MWGLALAGVPAIVIATDVLTQRRITDALREMLFRPEDTQIFEARDVIWAWALLVVGVAVTAWGLKELIVPAATIRADTTGLSLKVAGPFRPAVAIPWDAVDDIGDATVDDDGKILRVLWVKVFEPALLPDEPWGARLVADDTIAVLADDWERDPSVVAAEIADLALSVARSRSAEAEALDGDAEDVPVESDAPLEWDDADEGTRP